MPNAKDYKEHPAQKFLILGKAGSGKTSQFLTLPGTKFIYCFDPNAILTLRGEDVEYEEFLPDDLSLKLTSLSKDRMKTIPAKDRAATKSGADLYTKWEADFETRIADGFFDKIDNIGFDSFTTLSDMVMDGVLAINGRAGQWPQQDDYGPQMLALTNIVRTATSMGKRVYFTGHIETKVNDVTKKVVNEPVMTGRLRSKLPILFSEILICAAESDGKGNTNYTIQNRPDRYFDSVRSSRKDAQFKDDVTLDWSKPLNKQGIASLYNLTEGGKSKT